MFFFLSTKMLPVVAGLLPIYLFAKNTGMLDNIWLLVILYTSMNLPIAVWMMRSFLAEVPVAIIEAAADRRRAAADRSCAGSSPRSPLPGHRRHGADLLHLQLERAAVRPGAHRRGRRDRARLPDRLRHQPGPVPGQGVRRVASSSPCRCSPPGSPPRTSSSRACRWEPSNEGSRHRGRRQGRRSPTVAGPDARARATSSSRSPPAGCAAPICTSCRASSRPTLPIVPGHEFAGEVVGVGTEVTELAVGDRVAVDPSLYCHECRYCRTGQQQPVRALGRDRRHHGRRRGRVRGRAGGQLREAARPRRAPRTRR